MNDSSLESPRSRFRPEVLRLGILCGVLYFAQGLCEPATGLLKQPVDSLLKRRGFGEAAIGSFAFWVSLPWTWKLAYGMLSDFVPIAGYRRKSWLLISSIATTGAFASLALMPQSLHTYRGLMIWMTFANLCVAFGDVVIDATMVERGQPLGVTGRLQSIQWASMSVSSAIAGYAGGVLSKHERQDLGFGICAAFGAISVALVLFGVKEERHAIPEQSLGSVLRALGRTARSGTILAAAAFLFLWNFNPFSAEVLYLYQGKTLGFEETDTGTLLAIYYVSAALACFAYGYYCTRIRLSTQVHLSIVFGVVATVGYFWFHDFRSAAIVTTLTGAAYMTATVMQLDLCARVCPPQVAGTVFAVLMAVSNFGVSLSSLVGGWLYERWKGPAGATGAFQALVATGAAFTVASWILVPFLLKHAHSTPTEEPAT